MYVHTQKKEEEKKEEEKDIYIHICRIRIKMQQYKKYKVKYSEWQHLFSDNQGYLWPTLIDRQTNMLYTTVDIEYV